MEQYLPWAIIAFFVIACLLILIQSCYEVNRDLGVKKGAGQNLKPYKGRDE